MIHLTKALVRRWLDTLLHVDDTPERTAAAFAVGVFFGFSPFLGLHTLLAIVVAFLFELEPRRGAARRLLEPALDHRPLLRHRDDDRREDHRATRRPPDSRRGSVALFELSVFHGEFWHQLISILKPLLWPYTVGSMIGAVILARDGLPARAGVRDKSPPTS